MRLACCLLLVWAGAPARAQEFSQRGFLEIRNLVYPRTAPGDSGRLVSESLLRWEPSVKFTSSFRINASLDARADSHRQVERDARLDWRDRSLQRPAFSARRFSATYNKGGLTLEAGRQFIRWGKADLLNPTDRFAPRDFMNVVDADFLGVVAARATYERGGNTIDAVYQPVFTPSRTPLLNQRWTVLPPSLDGIQVVDLGLRTPGRGQAGLRYNRVDSGYEFSLCFFDGFNHLPLLDGVLLPEGVGVQRFYPRLRLYGGDLAVPLRWFTVKSEAAYFSSSTRSADEFLLYVIQLERQSGEWTFVGGYAGEAVTERRQPAAFAPDRGIAKTFLGRASYTIDANRSIAFEGAVRQTGAGGYGRAEYSQAAGAHWRITASAALLAGRSTDFLGQYRRNSHFVLAARYSF